MFEIGFWELVMVGVVALIVVGPERLPGLARTAGLWLGRARRMLAEVKAEVDRELQLEELKQSLRRSADGGSVKDLVDEVKALRADIQAELDDPGPPPDWRPGMPTAQPSDFRTESPMEPPLPGLSDPVQLQKPVSPPVAPAASSQSSPSDQAS